MTIEVSPTSPFAPFPKWLGFGWLFLVYLEVGYDWQRLALCGLLPWLLVWRLWDVFIQHPRVRALPHDTVDKGWLWVGRTMWFFAAVLAAAIFYANHYLPKGPMIDTGDVVCMNDDRGPCGEKFVEDTRRLAIPGWAKFMKDETHGLGSLILLSLAACVVSSRPKGGFPKT